MGNGAWALASPIFKRKNPSWYCFVISEDEQTSRQQQQQQKLNLNMATGAQGIEARARPQLQVRSS